MGGLALKHLNVHRIAAADYHVLANKVITRFTAAFAQQPDIVPAYRSKPDFGDCDLIVTTADLPLDWRETLAAQVASRGWSRNGDVTSMEIDGVQIDFIDVPRAARSFALVYFGYNDLGNLMGRIAHKMGFKYGHLGLQKVLRDGDHLFAEVPVFADNTTEAPMTQMAQVFNFLGYDYARYEQGFEALTDIFDYAASTPYFNPDIYLLHNRNHVSRIRDAKRKTYTEFLKWCETKEPITRWPWPTDEVGKATVHAEHLAGAQSRWPQFAARLASEVERHQQSKDLKTRWNGDLVSAWTGLTGRELGALMTRVRGDERFAQVSGRAAASGELRALVLEKSERGMIE